MIAKSSFEFVIVLHAITQEPQHEGCLYHEEAPWDGCKEHSGFVIVLHASTGQSQQDNCVSSRQAASGSVLR